jgi:hypothetical protein
VFSPWWQVESEFQVAGPGLEGGQVAVLRLHVASSYHVMNAAYSCKRGGRITQLQYLLQLFLRTSENSVKANLAERSTLFMTLLPVWPIAIINAVDESRLLVQLQTSG